MSGRWRGRATSGRVDRIVSGRRLARQTGIGVSAIAAPTPYPSVTTSDGLPHAPSPIVSTLDGVPFMSPQ